MPDRCARVLARLLSDAAVRREFLADPGVVAAQEGLSAEETATLATMPVQDLETAAWSFACKRNSKQSRLQSPWWRNLLGRSATTASAPATRKRMPSGT